MILKGSDQKEVLGGAAMLREVSDHLHHQNILKLHGSLHQHLQAVTWQQKWGSQWGDVIHPFLVKSWYLHRRDARCSGWRPGWCTATPAPPPSSPRCTQTPSSWAVNHRTKVSDGSEDRVRLDYSIKRSAGNQPKSILTIKSSINTLNFPCWRKVRRWGGEGRDRRQEMIRVKVKRVFEIKWSQAAHLPSFCADLTLNRKSFELSVMGVVGCSASLWGLSGPGLG